MTGTLQAREAGKFLHHAFIDVALEGNDEAGKIFQGLPTPLHEFRFVFAAGGMQSVTVMAGIGALIALVIVLVGVREVVAGSGDQEDPAAIVS